MGDHGLECVVEYEYSADLSDELTLRVGDVITNVEKMDGGWWKGRLRGQTGMFPDNFVKVLPGTPAAALKGDEGMGRRRCRVLFSYNPTHDDELELQVDDWVDFLCEVEDGWFKGRNKGRVGVFPSNFVETIEADNHAATVHEKNKKNSLQGSHVSNGTSVLSNATNKMNPAPDNKIHDNRIPDNKISEPIKSKDSSMIHETPKKETSANNSSGKKSMTTSERMLLRNSGPAPDTAPRLPPKPETSTPVELRRPTSTHRSGASLSTDVPVSSNLFDPEDEPMGPMFGRLSSRFQDEKLCSYPMRKTETLEDWDGLPDLPPLQERRGSLQVPPRPPSKQKKPGIFSRLRHSFGSKGKLPFFSRSRLSVGNLETQSEHIKSPVYKRRSLAALVKKVSPSCSNNPKYELKIERTPSSVGHRLSAHRDTILESPFSTRWGWDARPTDDGQGLVANLDSTQLHKSDFRDVPLSPDHHSSTDDPETSVSWVFQEMAMKDAWSTGNSTFDPKATTNAWSSTCSTFNNKQKVKGRSFSASEAEESFLHSPSWATNNPLPPAWEYDAPDSQSVRHPSGDSGVAWESLIHNNTQSTKDIESFFGSVGDLTDEMFDDIFTNKQKDIEFNTIQEEKEAEVEVVRTTIRTNPNVRWQPTEGVRRLQKVKTTEI